MLSQEVIEQLSKIFVKRAEEVNTFTLRTIAKQLKKIKDFKDLRPTEINKLVNLLKYGGDYNKIKKELTKMANKSQKDIDKIFENTAKKNQEFAKKFYEYRNINYIPFEKNTALKQQVKAIADVTKETYKNISNTRAIGLTKKVGKELIFMGLEEAYKDAIDRGIMAMQQGQTTLDEEMRKIVKEYSDSGLKYVEFDSGYRRRLDSQVRMNLFDGLAQVTQQVNLTFGEEFGADGVEIDAHYNPAPDHAEVQGRQFTNDEFYKFQNDMDAVDVQGKKFPKEHNGHDRRSIGQYNCQHNPYPIIIGVNKPVYTNEQLQEIIDSNLKGFDYEGKHYTMYEGTQLQRNIETEIRKAKDEQIMAVEIGDKEAIDKAQKKITLLNKKYKQISEVSGLNKKPNRMRVSGYKRVKVAETTEKTAISRNDKPKDVQLSTPKRKKPSNYVDNFEGIKTTLADKGVIVDEKLSTLEHETTISSLNQINNLIDKYPKVKPLLKNKNEKIVTDNDYLRRHWIGYHSSNDNIIGFTTDYYKDKQHMLEVETRCGDHNWHAKVSDENKLIYTATHEFGHLLEDRFIRNYAMEKYGYYGKSIREQLDKEIRDEMFDKIKRDNNMTVTQIKQNFISGYGNSKTHFEWFAETFARLELGEENPLTIEMAKWLERFYK